MVRVGTTIRLKSKGVLKNLAMTMKGTIDVDYGDLERISAIITDAEKGTAGLGLKWDELWQHAGDELPPYRERYPDLFDLATSWWVVLKCYGKHAAGVIISSDEDLTEQLPMRMAGDQWCPSSTWMPWPLLGS